MKLILPNKINEYQLGFWPVNVLTAGVKLNVFDVIADGKSTVPEIAAACKSSERGIGTLLNALVGMEMLDKNGDGGYELSDEAREYLVSSSLLYMGHMFEHSDKLQMSWMNLAECVKTGKPFRPPGPPMDPVAFFVPLVKGLFARNYGSAKVAAEKLGIGKSIKGANILDVAAGSGVWSIACLEADPTAKATAHDFGPILDVVKEKAAQRGLEGRYSYLPGDIRQVDFGENQFDMAILGHICHSEGAEWSRKLIAKMHKALKTGGKLVILDFLPDKDRKGPIFPLLFAANMLLNTEDGTTFTAEEYGEWLKEAGFGEYELMDMEAPSPLLVAEAK